MLSLRHDRSPLPPSLLRVTTWAHRKSHQTQKGHWYDVSANSVCDVHRRFCWWCCRSKQTRERSLGGKPGSNETAKSASFCSKKHQQTACWLHLAVLHYSLCQAVWCLMSPRLEKGTRKDKPNSDHTSNIATTKAEMSAVISSSTDPLRSVTPRENATNHERSATVKSCFLLNGSFALRFFAWYTVHIILEHK